LRPSAIGNKACPTNWHQFQLRRWLYEKGLQEGAQIWEQSVGLKSYGAVLSLLVIVEAVEKGK
jgi:hypothetical protein